MNTFKLNEQGWGDANDALEQEKQEKQKQQQQDTEKQKQSDKKKTIPTPPVKEKNPVNRVGKLTRDRRASFDWIEPNLLKDLETATKRAKIGNVQISWARTGHDIGSRHEYGYAVDLSMLNGKGYNGNQTEFTILGNILVAELIKLGYTYGEGANEKSYIWQTAEHYNHVHVSRKPPADAKKQKPADLNQANQSEIHKKIQRARWDLYNILTKYPDRYFQNFKSAFKPGAGGRVIGGDNEKAAAKWLTDSFDTVWNSKFKKWENVAHPYDVSNMRKIRLIVQWATKLILEQRAGKYAVNFWNYDEETKKWKQVTRTYRWDYM
jgi:hypothetical protein